MSDERREQGTSMLLPQRYQIPTHLQVPDTFSVPVPGFTIQVTVRQGLILLVGWSSCFRLWRDLEGLNTLGGHGMWIRALLPAVLALLVLILALWRIADRHLEEWALLVLRYHLQPKLYRWQREGESGARGMLGDTPVLPPRSKVRRQRQGTGRSKRKEQA